MPRELQPCGTVAAAARHLRRREPMDDACREARASYYRVVRATTAPARNAERPVTVVPSRVQQWPVPKPPRVPVPVDPRWRERAACGDVDTEAFYAEQLDEQRRAVRKVCVGRACPVVVDCLREAIDLVERHGVWGALTERDRNPLLDVRFGDPMALRCGSWDGPARHRRRGEPLCDDCAAAVARNRARREAAERARERYATSSRQQRPVGGEVPAEDAGVCSPGTRAGAQKHRRRGQQVCDACLAAEAAYMKARYQPRGGRVKDGRAA